MKPILSIIIVTHQRSEALARTLAHLRDHAQLPHPFEIIVIDNGSRDATAQVVAQSRLDIRFIRRHHNEGVAARNHGFAACQGKYILLIDDDSYPQTDEAVRMTRYMDIHPRCGAVVGRVVLPDGRLEASALPCVIANGAVCLRKSVIDQVGGFPWEFKRQAEEYDLSFRILYAGYHIDRFEDLLFRHDKAPGNRVASEIMYHDIRNNLILLDRYLPQPLRSEYMKDWLQRYHALALYHGYEKHSRNARWSASLWYIRHYLQKRIILKPQTLEAIFQFNHYHNLIRTWSADLHIDRVVIADFGKNIFSVWLACQQIHLSVDAVCDDHPAYHHQTYRGIPMVTTQDIHRLKPQGIIMSNVNPAQIEDRLRVLQSHFDGPVLALWKPAYLSAQLASKSRSTIFRSNIAAA